MYFNKYFQNFLFVFISIIIALVLFIIFEFSVSKISPQSTTLSGALAIPDSILGHINKPGAHVTVSGPEFTVHYDIDDRGFRYDPNSIERGNAKVRILVLGDSFTLGAGNNYKSIWSTLLEEKLLEAGYDIEITNGGVSGYDTGQEILSLERLVKDINPDIVVLTFLPNDLFTNSAIKTFKGEKLQVYKQKEEMLVRYHREKLINYHSVVLFKRILYSFDWLYHKLYLLTPRSEYYQFPLNEKVGRQIKITKDLLMRGLQYCSKHDIQFMVLSIPQQFQVIYSANGYQNENVSATKIDSIFSQFSRQNGFDWVSCLPFMSEHYKKNNNDLYYRYNGHLTPLGNKVVAEAIYPFIEKHISY